jgi:hypothetical protein
MYGLRGGEGWAREWSVDILAMGQYLLRKRNVMSLILPIFCIGAVGMFPRLAFVTLSNNLMILSLRSMMSEFFSERILNLVIQYSRLTLCKSQS